MRGDGRVFRRKGSGVWWLAYSHQGVEYRRSSGTTNKTNAQIMLRGILDGIRNRSEPPQPRRVTYEHLRELVICDYQINGKRLQDLILRIAHLDKSFSGTSAISITPERIQKHISKRLCEGAAAATVNQDLAALRRMFSLAIKQRLLSPGQKPLIEMLRVNNIRKGFFEQEQFRAVLRHLPDECKTIATVAYVTGWRRKELLTRQWRHLDLDAGWLRLEPGETKNREGRMFPLTAALRECLVIHLERTRDLERQTGKVIPWIFHRNGRPVRSFRYAWRRACLAAGVPGRLFHDFRRTAVRNLERAGVPRSAAMAMVGHKTEAIYRRYAIVDEGALREAAMLLDADAVTRVELGQKTDNYRSGLGRLSKKPLVREGGLEPPRLAAPDPKSGASAIPPLSQS
jgi:integrase